MHNAHLHTEDRALHSSKSTKQYAQKLVLALDIQSLMNTTLVLMKKKKTLYEGGLEPGTLELQKCLTQLLPLDYEITQVENSNLCLFTAVKTLGINYILLWIFLYIWILSSSPGDVGSVLCPPTAWACVCSAPPPHGPQCSCTVCSYATEREHDPGSTSTPQCSNQN